ncbi:hypothetical protein LAZ40_02290, partial [Cereibacter sphaeroides]
MTGRPLSLLDQIDHTDGLCGPFALAAQALLGGELRILWCADRRQFAQHDWPPSEPLALHVYMVDGDGTAVDAEGRRSEADLREAFGVAPGYRYRIEIASPARVGEVFRAALDTALVDEAAQLIREAGWDEG